LTAFNENKEILIETQVIILFRTAAILFPEFLTSDYLFCS